MPSKDRERARRRRRQGTCIRCGKAEAAPGRAKCETCFERHRAAERERYARAKAEGRLDAGRDTEALRRSGRARAKRRYDARRAEGRCTRCGICRPAEGTTVCGDCRSRRRAGERALWAVRRAAAVCGKCGAEASAGTSRCARCLALQAGRPVHAANARMRYARRRARRLCVDCKEPSQGAARCPACARRSWLRSAEHRGLPAGLAEFRVIVIDTGETLDVWETLAEARASVAFARLSVEDVEIVSDIPEMAGLTAWT